MEEVRLNTLRKTLEKLIIRTGRQGISPNIGGLKDSQTDIHGFPSIIPSPLQDLDPDSPTFGDTYFILGFDEI